MQNIFYILNSSSISLSANTPTWQLLWRYCASLPRCLENEILVGNHSELLTANFYFRLTFQHEASLGDTRMHHSVKLQPNRIIHGRVIAILLNQDGHHPTSSTSELSLIALFNTLADATVHVYIHTKFGDRQWRAYSTRRMLVTACWWPMSISE